MNNPLVSISCITYNHAPYIRQCLDGFLMQECDFEYEILIHDDASTDGTSEIIREYQEKYPEIIKPIIQTENQWSQGVRGMMARFNFPRAKGKYIALCEGDDYWTDPLKLQKQVNLLEANYNSVICFHPMSELFIQGNQELQKKSIFHKNITYRHHLLNINYISTLTVVFRRERYNENNLEKLMNLSMGDYQLYLSLLMNSEDEIIYVDETMGVYRSGRPESISNATPMKYFHKDFIKILKKISDIYNNITIHEKRSIESALAREYMNLYKIEMKKRKILNAFYLSLISLYHIFKLFFLKERQNYHYSVLDFKMNFKRGIKLFIKN